LNDYYNHIISNDLHRIWAIYSSPKEGVRLSAWSPHKDAVYTKTRPCHRNGCKLTQHLVKDATIGKYICPDNHQHAILYRWNNANPLSGKIHFSRPSQIKQLAERIHTMYSTAAIFDPSIIMLPRSHGYPYSHVKSYTIHFDIDVVSSTKTILDNNTREALQIAVDHIRDILDSCCPNSYSIMSSGNGMYVTISNRFCEGNDVCDILAKTRLFMSMVNIDLSEMTSRVKLDYGINNVARVFKNSGSMHQKYNYLCAVPFDPDVNLTAIDTSTLLTKNFTTERIAPDNKINWNNRVKLSEKQDFLRFLNDTCNDADMSVNRGAVTDAYQAVYKGKRIRYNITNYAAVWTHLGSRVYSGEMKSPIRNPSDVPNSVYEVLLESVKE